MNVTSSLSIQISVCVDNWGIGTRLFRAKNYFLCPSKQLKVDLSLLQLWWVSASRIQIHKSSFFLSSVVLHKILGWHDPVCRDIHVFLSFLFSAFLPPSATSMLKSHSQKSGSKFHVYLKSWGRGQKIELPSLTYGSSLQKKKNHCNVIL